MAKNQNHPRGSFNNCFDALIATGKNLSSLQSPISEKNSKTEKKKLQFLQNAISLKFFLTFLEMGFCRELRFFCIVISASKRFISAIKQPSRMILIIHHIMGWVRFFRSRQIQFN